MPSSAAGPHVPSARQHAIGVTLAVCVAFIWVGSSELVQILMSGDTVSERSHPQPYFITYVSLSTFSLCLLGFLRPSWRAKLYRPSGLVAHTPPGTMLDSEAISPLSSEGASSPPVHNDEDSDGDKGPELLQFDIEDPCSEDSHAIIFSAGQVLRMALVISPLFFLSDWIFTLGLSMTTVASTSTISTISGLFTLILGAFMKVERFSIRKLFAAIATIAGVAIICSFDKKKTQGDRNFVGDMVNVVSAFIYAVYTILLKSKTGPPGAVDISMLFSFMGAAVLIGGIPGLFLLHWTNLERFELPTPKLAGILFANALIGTVLSDFLWAKSVVLTTPMIGTLALSLSVPLSVIADILFRGDHFSLPYLIGVIMVFSGFVVVNWEEIRERSRQTTPNEHNGLGNGVFNSLSTS